MDFSMYSKGTLLYWITEVYTFYVYKTLWVYSVGSRRLHSLTWTGEMPLNECTLFPCMFSKLKI